MSILALTSDTLIGTPATGNIEYDGQFFGTDSNASRAQMQRIVRATAVASTSGTSFTFTSIPSWAKRITVLFASVRQNTGGANPFVIRLGTAGGIIATGYVGAQGYVGGGPAAGPLNTGFEIYFDTAANSYGGMLTLTNISGNTWVGSGLFGQTQGYTMQIGGSVDLGATLTQLRVTTINGTHTFANGIINIMYEG